ncbi:MAG TPA: hypothetical protein VM677_01510 [Actinokineospora sp.]|jgi:hypothetical protein|nr:hypothetical protein [Actinokineospora sp.]
MNSMTRDQARSAMTGYISPSLDDDCLTYFAQTGLVLDASRLIAQLRRELASDTYEPDAITELAALVAWAVAEFGRYTLVTYTTVRGPWETDDDGDTIGDERPTLSESDESLQFHTLRDAADWMEKSGLQRPSADPGPFRMSAWLTDVDPYVHPYDDTETTTTVHAGPGFTDRTWNALVAAVRWR